MILTYTVNGKPLNYSPEGTNLVSELASCLMEKRFEIGPSDVKQHFLGDSGDPNDYGLIGMDFYQDPLLNKYALAVGVFGCAREQEGLEILIKRLDLMLNDNPERLEKIRDLLLKSQKKAINLKSRIGKRRIYPTNSINKPYLVNSKKSDDESEEPRRLVESGIVKTNREDKGDFVGAYD
ncbi:hypothetical protein HY498_03310 [Candidatus Woesearchaeota archaeon]|nr:hypothetical protein [Candidatus Woesearchaeota archaeon]